MLQNLTRNAKNEQTKSACKLDKVLRHCSNGTTSMAPSIITLIIIPFSKKLGSIEPFIFSLAFVFRNMFANTQLPSSEMQITKDK
jgi:hypothetical protein